MTLTAETRRLLAAYGIAAPTERRPAKDRYVVVVRFDDGTEASRTPVATLEAAREIARRAGVGFTADISRIGTEDVAVECWAASKRVA